MRELESGKRNILDQNGDGGGIKKKYCNNKKNRVSSPLKTTEHYI